MENKVFWGEFLEMYKYLPELWNVNSEDYKNQNKKNLALNTLIEKLKEIHPNADRRMVTNKINTFRTNYRRDLRKVFNSAGDDEVFKSSLWYFPKLTFLNEVLNPNFTFFNETDSDASTSTMDESFEIDEPAGELLCMAKELMQRAPPAKPCCLQQFPVLDNEQKYISNILINDISFYASNGMLKMSHKDLIRNVINIENSKESIPKSGSYLPTPKLV